MPSPTIPTCTHIKANGQPCHSPALKGREFCYFHQRMICGVASPLNPRTHPTFILEDHESIQCAIMEIMTAIASGRIEQKSASLLLRALNIAERNSRRTRFQKNPEEMVREIPTYPNPEEDLSTAMQPSQSAKPGTRR